MTLQPLLPRDRSAHPVAYDPEYKTSVPRAPKWARLAVPATATEESGPVFSPDLIGPLDNNLIVNFAGGQGEAIGERILVHGRVMDQFGRPQRGVLIEMWQANAGGRYRHKKDGYLAPLDPHFGGCGRSLTDDEGRYQFLTVKPGAYPWPNRVNDWRPAHLHFSVFGRSWGQRLITQSYFQGDPLIDLCPIAHTIKDRGQLDRLVAPLDMGHSRPHDRLAYSFDIVLRGHRQTMFENRIDGL